MIGRPFIDLAAYNEPACYSFMRVMDFSDERTDITDHVIQICKQNCSNKMIRWIFKLIFLLFPFVR